MVENTSRPWSSVPSKNRRSPSLAHAGGVCASSRLRVLRSNGSCGAIQGANSAPSTMRSVTRAASTVTFDCQNENTISLSSRRKMPRGRAGSSELESCAVLIASGCARIDPNARIYNDVQEVNDEIDGQEDQGNQKQIGRHDRDIGVLHRLEKQQTHARPLKHGLRDDGESNDRAELQAGNRHHRDERVLERMTEINVAVGQTAGARELDVVGPQHLDHFRP